VLVTFDCRFCLLNSMMYIYCHFKAFSSQLDSLIKIKKLNEL